MKTRRRRYEKWFVLLMKIETTTSDDVQGSPKALLSNPYFTSTVTASALKIAYVNIPLAFARSNKLDMRNCELLVMDEKQRLWPTQLRGLDGHVRIYRMRDMWVANGLKRGDEFSLELVDNGNKPLMNFHR
ncbi:hypothetical protein R6Q57_023669 [Mikania cordata]